MPDGAAGRPVGTGGIGTGGAPLGAGGVGAGAAPLGAQPAPLPVSRPISPLFNIGGAPITVLGGVFSGGLPLGGPVTQIFRGGSAPMPPTLFVATITPAGPIGTFLLGSGGAPLGVATFGGGALPIGVSAPEARAVEAIQPRTALVGANPAIVGGVIPPAVSFGPARAAGAAPPIGGGRADAPSPPVGGALGGEWPAHIVHHTDRGFPLI